VNTGNAIPFDTYTIFSSWREFAFGNACGVTTRGIEEKRRERKQKRWLELADLPGGTHLEQTRSEDADAAVGKNVRGKKSAGIEAPGFPPARVKAISSERRAG